MDRTLVLDTPTKSMAANKEATTADAVSGRVLADAATIGNAALGSYTSERSTHLIDKDVAIEHAPEGYSNAQHTATADLAKEEFTSARRVIYFPRYSRKVI